MTAIAVACVPLAAGLGALLMASDVACLAAFCRCLIYVSLLVGSPQWHSCLSVVLSPLCRVIRGGDYSFFIASRMTLLLVSYSAP